MVNPSKPWLKNYPEGVPHDVDISEYDSLLDMFDECFERYPNRRACEYLGKFLTYGELDQYSRHFAAYLQNLGLEVLPSFANFFISTSIDCALFFETSYHELYICKKIH